jgi:hypothetical protein
VRANRFSGARRQILFLQMSETGLDIRLFASAKSCIASFLGPGVWRLRGYCTLVRKRAERDAMGSFRPTTYLTIEELQQIASAKFEEAAAFPDGPQRLEILKSAHGFRNLAEIKGWLSSDLQPRKRAGS